MYINTTAWNTSLPEFTIEGYWCAKIVDDTKNSIKSTSYFSEMDIYLQSVNIPQLALEIESNDFGLMSFKGKSAYDELTITFYDDIKCSMSSFFMDWLHCIYSETNQVLLSNWRYETKNIYLEYYRYLNGSVKNIMEYQAYRCLPKSMSEISAEEESGSRKTYSVSLLPQIVYDVSSKTKKAGANNKSFIGVKVNND